MLLAALSGMPCFALQLVETTTNKIDDRRTPWLYDFSVITNPSLLSRPGLMLPYVCHQLKASVTEGFLARSFIVGVKWLVWLSSFFSVR